MVLPFADGLLSQTAGFVPPFLAYVCASRSNLLAYYHLQHGTPITFCRNDPVKAKQRSRIVFSTGAALLASVVILNFVQRSFRIAWVETCVAMLFLPVAFLLTEMAIGNLLGLYHQRLLGNRKTGLFAVQLRLVPDASHFWYRIAASNIFASLCIIGAFGYHETMSICILYTCSLYVSLSTTFPGTETNGMQTVLLGSIFESIAIYSVAGIALMILWFAVFKTRAEEEPGDISSRLIADAQWLLPASMSPRLIHIISIALRFDYSNCNSRPSELVSYFRLEDRKHGFRRRTAKIFSRTYHFASLFSFIATALLLHTIFFFVPESESQATYEGLDLGGYSLEPEWITQPRVNSMMNLMNFLFPLSLMTIPITIYCVALWCGQVNALWAYKENWTTGIPLDTEKSSRDPEASFSLPSSRSGGSLAQKQPDLLSMQRVISDGKYRLDSAGMLRAFVRGQVAKDISVVIGNSRADGEIELTEDESSISVLVLAFDYVLLIVDESLGPIEDYPSAPVLTQLPIDCIASLKSSVSVEGACSLTISILYNNDAPSDLEIFFNNQTTLLKLKETVTTLAENAQVIENLRERVPDQACLNAGNRGNLSKCAEFQNLKATHSLERYGLRRHAKALVRRDNETKISYLYLFTDALICVRSIADSETTAHSCWSDRRTAIIRNVRSKLTSLPGWETAVSWLTIRDDMDAVADSVPPGDGPLVLEERIFVKQMESIVAEEYEAEHSYGFKIYTKCSELAITASPASPFEAFFPTESERAEWLEELKSLISAKKIPQSI